MSFDCLIHVDHVMQRLRFTVFIFVIAVVHNALVNTQVQMVGFDALIGKQTAGSKQ